MRTGCQAPPPDALAVSSATCPIPAIALTMLEPEPEFTALAADRRDVSNAEGMMPVLLAVPLAILAVLLVLVTLPASFSLMATLQARDGRRLRAAAEQTRCSRCGHRLGGEAVDEAEVAWAATTVEARLRNPHIFLWIVPYLHTRCTCCGVGYDWDVQRLAFRLLCDPVVGAATALDADGDG